ncbi:hypothetical protein ACFLY5_00855 [Patescibacteria group bacterium]
MKTVLRGVLVVVVLLVVLLPLQVFAQSKTGGSEYTVFVKEFQKIIDRVYIRFSARDGKGKDVEFCRKAKEGKIDLTNLLVMPGLYKVNLSAGSKNHSTQFLAEIEDLLVEAEKISFQKPIFKLQKRHTYVLKFNLEREVFPDKEYFMEIYSVDDKLLSSFTTDTGYKNWHYTIGSLDLKITAVKFVIYKIEGKSSKRFVLNDRCTISPFLENKNGHIFLGKLDFKKDPEIIPVGTVSFNDPVFEE